MVGNAVWPNLNLGGTGNGLNLGGQPAPNASPYQMPRLPWSQNDAVTMAALGLIGGNTLNQGFQNVAQMVPAGLASNTAKRRDMYSMQEKARTKAEEDARKAQLNEVIKNWPGIPENLRAAMYAQPELFIKYAETTMLPAGFRQATPEEAAAYGSPAGQFGPDGRFYPNNPPSGMRLVSDGAGGFTFEQGSGVAGAAPGNRPLTTGTAGGEQKDIGNLETQRQQVERIGELYDPSFLTYAGKGRAAWAEQADKLGMAGPEDKKILDKRTRFINNVEQVFNQYRQDITGAGAALAELERLKDSVINTGQSPSQFQASLGEYARALKRGLDIKKQLIDAGIDPGTTQFSKRFEQEFLSQSAEPLTDAAASSSPAPSGVSQEEWDAMTPEEQDLFD